MTKPDHGNEAEIRAPSEQWPSSVSWRDYARLSELKRDPSSGESA
jgi:hypothetical protein